MESIAERHNGGMHYELLVKIGLAGLGRTDDDGTRGLLGG